jgi:hypothetical protein
MIQFLDEFKILKIKLIPDTIESNKFSVELLDFFEVIFYEKY